jgi:site-specific DNA recombinase
MVTHRLRQRQEQLQSRKWEIETLLSDRRVELASLGTVTHYVDDLRNLLGESSLTERKSFIQSFVKEVKVTGDEVLLTCTMPLPPQGISEERVGVLCSVHYGGEGGTRTPKTSVVTMLQSTLQLTALSYYLTPVQRVSSK